jgi:acetyl-CoA carboxylase biotin carboxyl carrier protein
MTFSSDDIRALIAEFDASDWEEIEVIAGDVAVVISRSSSSEWIKSTSTSPKGVPAPDLAAGIEVPSSTSGGQATTLVEASPPERPVPTPVAHPVAGREVTSPTVGLFWRSPQPGTPPFVEIGQRVEAGDTVCIIEVMKLMNQVKTEVSGKILSIEAENGVLVEHGTVLMLVDPDA